MEWEGKCVIMLKMIRVSGQREKGNLADASCCCAAAGGRYRFRFTDGHWHAGLVVALQHMESSTGMRFPSSTCWSPRTG